MLHAHAVGRARGELRELRAHPHVPAAMLEEVISSAETSARRHGSDHADRYVFILGDDEVIDADAAARVLGGSEQLRHAVARGRLRPVDGQAERFLAAEVIALRARARLAA